MRVVVVTSGSTGDVAPYTGLAAGLAAAGHDVAIATHERFAGLVAASGVGFRLLGGDPNVFRGEAEAGEADVRTPVLEAGLTPRALAGNVRRAASYTRQLAHHVASAIEDGGADALLLSATVAPLAWHVAEGLDVPSVGVYLQPVHRTRAFPPPFVAAPPLGTAGGWAALGAVEAAIDAWIAPATRELRRELGLPPLRPRALRRRLEAARWPVCYGFSPAVVPRPGDWRPGLDVVGYWWPHHLASWCPPPDIVDFLDAGPPPVFVSFGSLEGGVGDRLAEVVLPALRRAGARAVIQGSWATAGAAGRAGPGTTTGLAAIDGDADTLVVAGHVDYEWLLPRVTAVVHHAGAGTTAATLRAGVPSVPIPLGFDNAFWADRLAALGVAPAVVPLDARSTPRLAAAIRQAATDPAHRARAQTLARQIATEDGATRVLDVLGATVRN